jgi:hypothetical protein
LRFAGALRRAAFLTGARFFAARFLAFAIRSSGRFPAVGQPWWINDAPRGSCWQDRGTTLRGRA